MDKKEMMRIRQMIRDAKNQEQLWVVEFILSKKFVELCKTNPDETELEKIRVHFNLLDHKRNNLSD